MARAFQPQLDFEARNTSGLTSWQAEQVRLREELARSLGLPLGKAVEVWLKGGVRLRGELELEHSSLIHAEATQENTRLRVGGTTFGYSEIESCVRC